ncbi:hypothetical protein Hanom_Chr13g01208961 [Helianthus anomalus]
MISGTSLSSSDVKSIIGKGVKSLRLLTNFRFPDEIFVNVETLSDAITVFGEILDEDEGMMSKLEVDDELLVIFVRIPLEDAMFPKK